MNRPTPEQILRALEGFADPAGRPPQAHQELLVLEAAAVGYQVLCRQRYGLRSHVHLSDPGPGYGAVAEMFRGAPECPKLREVASTVVWMAGGDPERAALHFRNIARKYAENHAKALLRDANPIGSRIRRNVTLEVGTVAVLRGKVYFLSAREARQDPIPSDEHVEELVKRCGAREWRIPRLVAATRTILAERPQYAPWIALRQIEADYLEIMTVGLQPPGGTGASLDPDDAMMVQEILAGWGTDGRKLARQRFLATTELPADIAANIFAAYCDYFEVWVTTTGRVDRYEFLEKRLPGLRRGDFRKQYKPTMDRLHGLVLLLLRERFKSKDASVSVEGGESS